MKQVHGSARAFFCSFGKCKKSYTKLSNLKQHIAAKHDPSGIPARYSCQVRLCDKTYASQGGLTRHIQRCHRPQGEEEGVHDLLAEETKRALYLSRLLGEIDPPPLPSPLSVLTDSCSNPDASASSALCGDSNMGKRIVPPEQHKNMLPPSDSTNFLNSSSAASSYPYSCSAHTLPEHIAAKPLLPIVTAANDSSSFLTTVPLHSHTLIAEGSWDNTFVGIRGTGASSFCYDGSSSSDALKRPFVDTCGSSREAPEGGDYRSAVESSLLGATPTLLDFGGMTCRNTKRARLSERHLEGGHDFLTGEETLSTDVPAVSTVQ